MINAMLVRVHQSGHLAELSAERMELVKEGIACYKEIRGDIKRAVPYYPLGVADNEDLWVCGGLQTEDRAYLAVWKRQMEGKNNDRRLRAGTVCSDTALSIPLAGLSFAGAGVKVSCLYPKNEPVCVSVEKDVLEVTFEKPVMARLFVVER